MASETIVIPDNFKCNSINRFKVPEHYREYLDSILIPEKAIQKRIHDMAKDIFEDYIGESLHLVCVLKGGERVFSDLTYNLIKLNCESNTKSVPITYDFITASSYNNTQSTGTVNIVAAQKQLEGMRNKNVLLIEDIIDTGDTIRMVKDKILGYDPKSLKIASLLIKRIGKEQDVKPNYCGFSIPDKFVVGYCLDYNQYFRDLQHIAIINSAGKEKFKE